MLIKQLLSEKPNGIRDTALQMTSYENLFVKLSYRIRGDCSEPASLLTSNLLIWYVESVAELVMKYLWY